MEIPRIANIKLLPVYTTFTKVVTMLYQGSNEVVPWYSMVQAVRGPLVFVVSYNDSWLTTRPAHTLAMLQSK